MLEYVVDEATFQQAAHEDHVCTAHPSVQNPAPAPSSARPAPARRTP
ncbi:hypothetical protein ACMZ5E_00250 [Streptomyces rhizosphaericola]